MESLDIIKRPVITEKSMLAMDEKKYTLGTGTCASKTLVKQTVESTFDVKVANVNILNVRSKFRHIGKYIGYTKRRRKTIATLTRNSKETQLFGAAEQAIPNNINVGGK